MNPDNDTSPYRPAVGAEFRGEQLSLPGPVGPLEALTAYPPGFAPGSPIAIVCHPHSLHGGSMTNKVVHIVAKTLNELGVATLRFNFRGVGRSGGEYAEGVGEADDLCALADWFRARHPGSPLWLAGFSFGAYVAARAQSRLGAERLLLVAPPVTLFDVAGLGTIAADRLLVVQGGRDEVIDPTAVAQWAKGQPPGLSLHWLTSADHYFHGRLTRLHDILLRAWGPEAP